MKTHIIIISLGTCLKKYDLAIVEYDKAIQINPKE